MGLGSIRLPSLNVWPVVQRELRAGSRRWFTYWMRVMAAGLTMFALWSITETQTSNPAMMGRIVFGVLNSLLLLIIYLLVPAMTADCIAREKREGTLGLLFLTPLTAGGVVIGKLIVQALKAWTLWLAVVPTLAIPALLGGIVWQDFVSAVAFQLCAVLITLASGLTASSFTQVRNLAFSIAQGLATCAGFGLLLSIQYELAPTVTPQTWFPEIAFHFVTGLGNTGAKTIWPPGFIRLLAQSVSISLLGLILSLSITARHVRNSWHDKPPSPKREWWLKRFCTELFQDKFRQKMQETLDWNPIAWLQQYSWKARLSKWGLCLLFTLIVCGVAVLGELADFTVMYVTVNRLILILGVMYTFIGVSSFLVEKQTGALELLLITPLSVNQIIVGRAWGLCKQFMPSILLLAGFEAAAWWINSNTGYYRPSMTEQIELQVCVTSLCFVCLPIFSTYAALRVKYMIGAGVLTWVGLFLGFAFGMCLKELISPQSVLGRPYSPENDLPLLVACLILSYLAFVGLTFFLLRHSLSRRIYSF